MPNKGATGPGKGFSTSGGSATEDSPGWDPRVQGNRRFGKGTVLPGGKRAGVDHGVHRRPDGTPDYSRNSSKPGQTPSKSAILKRLKKSQ